MRTGRETSRIIGIILTILILCISFLPIDIISTSNLSNTPVIQYRVAEALAGYGTITVTSDPPGQPFTLYREGKYYYGGLTTWSVDNAICEVTYSIVWCNMPGYITPLPEAKPLPYEGSITFHGIYKPGQETNKIDINSSPLGAAFTLIGPTSYNETTPWQASNIPVGIYTLTWLPMSGYLTPSAETVTIEEGVTCGKYIIYQPLPDSGYISVTSNLAGASFSLIGPPNYSGTVPFNSSAPVGSYTINWNEISGYTKPPPQTQTVAKDCTTSFYGNYQQSVPQTPIPPPAPIPAPTPPPSQNPPATPQGQTVNKQVQLGPYVGEHKYYLSVSNVDDKATAKVNGTIVKTLNYHEESGWIEITNLVGQGENLIDFSLNNISGGWTYGFALKQDAATIWQDSCGSVGVAGCNSNDQTSGLVYHCSITFTAIGAPSPAPTPTPSPTPTPTPSPTPTPTPTPIIGRATVAKDESIIISKSFLPSATVTVIPTGGTYKLASQAFISFDVDSTPEAVIYVEETSQVLGITDRNGKLSGRIAIPMPPVAGNKVITIKKHNNDNKYALSSKIEYDCKLISSFTRELDKRDVQGYDKMLSWLVLSEPPSVPNPGRAWGAFLDLVHSVVQFFVAKKEYSPVQGDTWTTQVYEYSSQDMTSSYAVYIQIERDGKIIYSYTYYTEDYNYIIENIGVPD